jgi:hypothetical protein
MLSRRSRRLLGLEPDPDISDSSSNSSDTDTDGDDDDDDVGPDIGDTFVAFVSNAGKTYAVRIKPKQPAGGNASGTYPISHDKVAAAFTSDVHTAAEPVRQSWWVYSPAVRRQMLNAGNRLNAFSGSVEYKMPTANTSAAAVAQWRNLHPLQRSDAGADLLCNSAESAACTCAQWKFRIVDSYVAGPVVDYSLDPTPAAKQSQKNSNRVDDRCEGIRQARNVLVYPHAGFVVRTHVVRRSCDAPVQKTCKHMRRVDAYLSNPVRAATPLDAPLQLQLP